jgi:hypothetical protein
MADVATGLLIKPKDCARRLRELAGLSFEANELMLLAPSALLDRSSRCPHPKMAGRIDEARAVLKLREIEQPDPPVEKTPVDLLSARQLGQQLLQVTKNIVSDRETLPPRSLFPLISALRSFVEEPHGQGTRRGGRRRDWEPLEAFALARCIVSDVGPDAPRPLSDTEAVLALKALDHPSLRELSIATVEDRVRHLLTNALAKVAMETTTPPGEGRSFRKGRRTGDDTRVHERDAHAQSKPPPRRRTR